MAYRIVEFVRESCNNDNSVEIGSYQSAYRAMRVMKSELVRRSPSALNWYLLDPQGQILAYPDDVVDASVA